MIIIDALRYDFTVPFRADAEHATPRHFHNGLPLLYDTAVSKPDHAVLLPFIADPPTTTLQRLKGLTTGTLPTFIDAGSNFAGTSIEEDNLIAQLLDANKTVVHLGDDTWQSLFPGLFDPELTRPFDSFNVWDLHTVDNGVSSNLLPILQSANASKWDVVIGHYLGVDHAGHRYGPDHPAMKAKLQQMNEILTRVIELLDDKTLLVVMGDHGMDSKGDHGGESDDEIEAALWMYSKAKRFGRISKDTSLPPPSAKVRSVNQIDLVPTLALHLGLPIPFNNLGAPIQETFIGSKGNDWQNLASVNALAAAQIRRYQKEYAAVRKPDAITTAEPNSLWDEADELWSSHSLTTSWSTVARKFAEYQSSNLRVDKDLWARFDILSMSQGICVLILIFIVTLHIAQGTKGDVTELAPVLLSRGLLGLVFGAVLGSLLALAVSSLGIVKTAVFGSALTCTLTLLYQLSVPLRHLAQRLIPSSIWSGASVLFVLLTAVGFGSNSYTIWEDESSLFFLSSFLLLALSASFRLPSRVDRRAAFAHIFVIFTSLRLASLSRLCRDEQMPYCRSTFYASSSTTTSAPWQLVISWLVALTLPQTIKSFYRRTQNYTGSAPFWIGFATQAQLFLVSCYWTLDAADDGSWLEGSKLTWIDLKGTRILIARAVLMVAVGAGTGTFLWMAPCFAVERVEDDHGDKDDKPQLVLHGTQNLYGSHYALLPLSIALIPLLLVQKPMGQLALALTALASLSSLELFSLLQKVPRAPSSHTNPTTTTTTTPISSENKTLASQLLTNRPPLTQAETITTVLFPTFTALLAHFTFFKTGHQAALASIQWDAAFIPLKTLRYPWAPLLIVLNTLGGQILGSLLSVLAVLWRRPYHFSSVGAGAETRDQERRKVLSLCVRATMTHGAVYAALNLASTVLTAHLRRHLMLYRVFMPRWALSVVGWIVVEAVGLLAMGGVGRGLAAVAGVFGW